MTFSILNDLLLHNHSNDLLDQDLIDFEQPEKQLEKSEKNKSRSHVYESKAKNYLFRIFSKVNPSKIDDNTKNAINLLHDAIVDKSKSMDPKILNSFVTKDKVKNYKHLTLTDLRDIDEEIQKSKAEYIDNKTNFDDKTKFC